MVFHLENGESVNLNDLQIDKRGTIDDLCERVSNETGWCVLSVEE